MSFLHKTHSVSTTSLTTPSQWVHVILPHFHAVSSISLLSTSISHSSTFSACSSILNSSLSVSFLYNTLSVSTTQPHPLSECHSYFMQWAVLITYLFQWALSTFSSLFHASYMPRSLWALFITIHAQLRSTIHTVLLSYCILWPCCTQCAPSFLILCLTLSTKCYSPYHCQVVTCWAWVRTPAHNSLTRTFITSHQ